MNKQRKRIDWPSMRLLVFRVPDETKRKFRIAMLEHHTTMQDVFSSFVEALVVYNRHEKQPADLIRMIIKRAQALKQYER